MSNCFLSYRRKTSFGLAVAIKTKLSSDHNIEAYMDNDRANEGVGQFPRRLLNAISGAPVFVCLLGEGTLESELVLQEIQHAYILQKPCIPVFQEGYREPEDKSHAVAYLLQHEGVPIFDQQGAMFDESVEKLARMIASVSNGSWVKRLLVIGAVIALIAVVFGLWQGVFVNNADEVMPTPTFTATITPSPTPTQEQNLETTAEFLALQQTQAYEEQLTNSFSLTSTAEMWTPTPTETLQPHTTVGEKETLDAVIQISPTQNADWTPIERDFDGVTMVLVPKGCFMMGNYSYDIASPIHNQCFDKPFWIDKYEVTQTQFQQFEGKKNNINKFDGAQLPVDSINWFEARDFCAIRNARLPTEREWEYAAGGVESWLYPWGDELDIAKAVLKTQTENVGSIPSGASWVGAMDMTGNVFEWTSSLSYHYPYKTDDGREQDTGNNDDIRRIARGGSWRNLVTSDVRIPLRLPINPFYRENYVGVRCARDYIDTE